MIDLRGCLIRFDYFDESFLASYLGLLLYYFFMFDCFNPSIKLFSIC
jgi:hypothetical protein